MRVNGRENEDGDDLRKRDKSGNSTMRVTSQEFREL